MLVFHQSSAVVGDTFIVPVGVASPRPLQGVEVVLVLVLMSRAEVENVDDKDGEAGDESQGRPQHTMY